MTDKTESGGSGKALTMLDLNKYERVTNAPVLNINDVAIEQTFVDYRKLKDSVANGHRVF
ncbi:MAG: hypothetical protein IPO32_17970 [Crocinitomicaceae bacterium]|nr:hypothetical protein [Crocinitomicaceae bacterium]